MQTHQILKRESSENVTTIFICTSLQYYMSFIVMFLCMTHTPHSNTDSLAWFVLFSDTWSQYRLSVSCMTILFSKLANRHLRHQAIQKIGCQPGDCIWLHRVCVGMYGLTHSLYHPQEALIR